MCRIYKEVYVHMLILKIVFGIIVTLPILILADFLFENTVADAVVGTSKKKKKPLLQRLFPGLKMRRKKRKRGDKGDKTEESEESAENAQNSDSMTDEEFFNQFDNIDSTDNE